MPAAASHGAPTAFEPLLNVVCGLSHWAFSSPVLSGLETEAPEAETTGLRSRSQSRWHDEDQKSLALPPASRAEVKRTEWSSSATLLCTCVQAQSFPQDFQTQVTLVTSLSEDMQMCPGPHMSQSFYR